MAKITPEELVQNVQEFIQEDLKFDPPQSRRFFTTNIFQRTLAHIVGWTPWGSRMLRCTSAGELKTAPTTTGIEDYAVIRSTQSTTWSADKEFGVVVSRVDIFISVADAEIELIKADKTWGALLQIPVGFYSIDFRCAGFHIRAKEAGTSTSYQLIGWW